MKPKAVFTLVVLFLLSTGVGCNSGGNGSNSEGDGGTQASSDDVFASVRGWIAFRRGSEIVAIDPANPDDMLVLASSVDDDPIGWSSDGTKLLLRSPIEESGIPSPGLFVLHSDGSRTTLVQEESESPPRWSPATWGSFSPDGTEVAFASDGSSRGPYIISADGGKPSPLGAPCERRRIGGRVVELCGEPLSEAAAWSPDGSRIAWVDFVEDSPKYGHHAGVLSFVNPDGGGLREEVAPLPGEGGASLVWSPDGSQLAFWGPSQIFIINADGSHLRELTDEGVNRWPAWSPDGSRIAFVHNGNLATMAADGTDLQMLGKWAPDGAIAWNPLG
jgi:Tol biopolymer transport system component